MAFRKSYNPRAVVVLVGPLGAPVPILGLSDSDDSIQASMNEELFDDPDMDLSGEFGRHIENANQSGNITLEVKNSSPSLSILQTYVDGRLPLEVVIKDSTTMMAGVIGNDGRAVVPEFVRGKRPANPTFVIKCTKLKINHDGPRTSPI